MDYLTVKEVAELKCCSERYIQQLCKQNKISCISKLSSKNRTIFKIPVSALPEDLQAKYYRQKRTESGLLPEKIETEKADKTGFKYGLNSP